MTVLNSGQRLVADVLVIGGGPAGCWAALAARETGATVILAEKGYVGTAGATAAGNSSIIDAGPGAARDKAIAQREARGLGLVRSDVVDRVLEETYVQLNNLADWGYRFPTIDDGSPWRGSMRGVDYLRFLRQRLIKSGVTILDQSPALELLISEGVISGARGVRRVDGETWQVASGAVVLASGGCAFRSGALGTRNLTGDAYLMAAEAGARFSGMDFTGQYGIAPLHCSVTKGIVYYWATFTDEAGNVIGGKGDRQDAVAEGLKHGSVFAVLDKASPRVQSGMRGQPNVFMPFDRQGIDPFTQRFEVGLLYEGTVRGNGGLIVSDDTATEIPGLFAAGDTASREAMAGATSGGGGPNSSWAVATGRWSGLHAARFAGEIGAKHAERDLRSTGGGDLRAVGAAAPDVHEVVAAIQAEVLPLDRGFWRSADRLNASAVALETAWQGALDLQHRIEPIQAREVLAMAASARWINASARQRKETRGIQRRVDIPGTDPSQTGSIMSGGLSTIWAEPAQIRRQESRP